MTLGILNQEALDKEIIWQVFGTVPKVEEENSRGEPLMLSFRHADGIMEHRDVLKGTRMEGVAISILEDYQ